MTKDSQKESWYIDLDFLSMRVSSLGFSVEFITIYFKEGYRSLFSFDIYARRVWTFDLLFYKFIKD